MFNFLGTYNSGTAYVINDVVTYNNAVYVCILATTGNLPTNTTYWGLMLPAGAAMGPSGPSHAAGIAPDPGSVPGTQRLLREDATWQIACGAAYVSDTYDFSPQSPGGTLSAGSQTITLSPMPRGLVVGNYLYLTGGSGGVTEAARITAVGASSVTVTCNQSHGTGWTIQSASSGIQECLAANTGGAVYIPTPATQDSIPIYAQINIPTYDWQIFGDGPAQANFNPQMSFPLTTLAAQFDDAPLLSAIAASACVLSLHVHDLSLRGAAIGDSVATGDGIYVENYLRFLMEHVHITLFDGNGITLNNSYGALIDNDCFIVENGLCGINVSGSLANVLRISQSTIALNVRKTGNNGLANILIGSGAALTLVIDQCDIESPGAHGWLAVAGTVNTSGTAVTGPSGFVFSSAMNGTTVVIAGASYVFTYNTSTSGTLDHSAGTQTGAAFSWTNVTYADNIDVSGSCYAVNITGCYIETPLPTNHSNNNILQADVYQIRIQGNWIQDGPIQIVNTMPTGSIQHNTFTFTGGPYGNVAIWTPYDPGDRHQLEIYPNYYSGAVNSFGSALLTTSANGWWSSAAPSTGSWLVRDKVYNTSPTSGGYIGWVCVAAGRPAHGKLLV